MTSHIPGLHHVTAISGPPQANVDFYVGRLGQRLVKTTVNFDDPRTYHLYYGDRVGNPGTILTFFPFADAGPGRAGPGMASAVAYVLEPGGLDRWMTRLAEDGFDFEGPSERFGERFIALADPDGLRIELVEAAGIGADAAAGPSAHDFHSVTLWLDDPAPTARLLSDVFGYAAAGHERWAGANGAAGERLRFQSPSGARGAIVDLIRTEADAGGRPGTGTVHHVAFRAESDEAQEAWRERVAAAGHQVTPVIDRQYFKAIYFRTPGGVLFEIATDPPGFATDETVDELGSNLRLPPRYEAQRAAIERALPPLRRPA